MKYMDLIFLFVCLGWCFMGFCFGVEYQKGREQIQPHYVYKNKCLAPYEGKWMAYNCSDTLIEGDQ